MQKKVLRILHYALNPAAYLLLGASETVGESSELFSHGRSQEQDLPQGARRARRRRSTFGFAVQATEAPPAIQPTSRSGRRAVLATVARSGRCCEIYGPPGRGDQRGVRHRPLPRGAPAATSSHARGAQLQHRCGSARRAAHRSAHGSARGEARSRSACRGRDAPRPRGQDRASSDSRCVPIVEPDRKSRCFLVVFHEPDAERERRGGRVRPAVGRLADISAARSSSASCASPRTTCRARWRSGRAPTRS